MDNNKYKYKYKKYKFKYLELKREIDEFGMTDLNKSGNLKSKYLQLKGGNNAKTIFISGISGSGKTTLGKEIAQLLHGKFIDQDWFFTKHKPMIKLSNGKVVKNWDTEKALDMRRFNETLRNAQKTNKYVVVSGFALRDELIDKENKPDLHIHIKIPEQLSLQTRLKLKPGNEVDQTLMFNEVLLPFYHETLKRSKINYFINGTINGSVRREKQEMIDEIMGQIKKL